MTELEKLRKQKEDFECRIEDLQEEVDTLECEKNTLMEQVLELEEKIGYVDLDISTLDKLMMAEKLRENWPTLTMSDIQAICRV